MAFSQEAMAANIRAERSRRDLTQEELAEMVGVAKSTVCSWETDGGALPTAERIIALCKAFGVTPNYLFSYE